MNEECLIYKAPLEYLEHDELMEYSYSRLNNQCIGQGCPFNKFYKGEL